MSEIYDLSDSEEDDMDFEPHHVTIPSFRSTGENGEGSSGTNVRSALVGLGFKHELVEKAIRQHGEGNMELLVETILEYPGVETSEKRSLPPANAYEDEELAHSNAKRKAVLISNSESSESFKHLFGDDVDVSSPFPTSNPLKEDPDDECCGATDDKKASLLMMKFTMEEIDLAIRKLGEDAPVDELVDSIIAAQTGSTDDLNQTLPTRNEEAATTTETLIETLVDMGFTEQEISVAIEKYGVEVSIQELANGIVRAQMGVPNVKTEEDTSTSFGENSGMRNKFKSTSMGATKVLDAGFYSDLALRTEETFQASKIKDLNPIDRFKGTQEEQAVGAAELIGLQRPKPEFADDLNSYSGSSRNAPQRPISYNILQRRLKHKAKRMAAMAVPKLIQPSSCSSVDRMVAKTPLFFYGNTTNLSPDTWVKISQHLYSLKPQFVNTKSSSASSRKGGYGYIHNLPTEKEARPHKKMFPLNHSNIDGLGVGERLHLIEHSFDTHTLGYELSVLKSLFPEGITLLSMHSGAGGAEITLNRLGIRLKNVVSFEPSELGRKMLKRWWEESDQRGKLVQIENIQQLSTEKLKKLMEKYGVFDFVIFQGPYTYSPTSVTMTATEPESYEPLNMSMFFEFVRVLRIIRSEIKT